MFSTRNFFSNKQKKKMKPYKIKNKRELFFDDFLTEDRSNLEIRLHEPHAHTPEPSLPDGYYMTMIQHDGTIRCYCRRNFSEFTKENPQYTVKSGFVGEYTAYNESAGGIKFLEPPLFLYDCGVPNVMYCMKVGTHNFCPFYDENPACPKEEKYKAIGGVCDQGGIFGFVSADSYTFKLLSQKPLIEPKKEWEYCFDSQNVVFWSELENCYVCYFRLNKTPDGRKLRTIGKITSPDFRVWSKPTYLNINLENENLYVSLIAPYPRAKHLYIGTPTRYIEDRGSVTDITLVFSRDGIHFIRPFPGAWIKPGPDPERWKNRANYLAYNIVQTKPEEMSLYHSHSHIRYSLRTDGFTSLTAAYSQGEWISKTMQYENGWPEFNIATSARGYFKVELQTPDGKPFEGYSLAESKCFYGDKISYTAQWNNNNKKFPLKKNDLFRIRCILCEADLYSFSFQNPSK